MTSAMTSRVMSRVICHRAQTDSITLGSSLGSGLGFATRGSKQGLEWSDFDADSDSDASTNMSTEYDSDRDSEWDAFSQYSHSDSVGITNTEESSRSSSVDDDHIDIDKDLKVTWTVAEILPVAENQTKPGFKRRSTWSHNSNKSRCKKVTRVLFDSGSDGDILFHEKGTPKHFSTLRRQVLVKWHTSSGDFYTNERACIDLQFFNYSESKRYSLEPDVVEFERKDKPMFDLIIGAETMKELGIVLDFRTMEITVDEVTLPMRNANQLSTKTKMYQAWRTNNSLRLELEPESTQEATKRAVHILDAKYEKADLQSVVDTNCKHLSLDERQSLLDLLKDFEDLFDGTLGDWKTEPVSFELKEGAKPYHGRPYPVPKVHKETIKKRS